MNIEVIRATETWQQAGAYYVRIQGMARQHNITLRQEFDDDDTPDTKYIVLTDDQFPVATCRLCPLGKGTGLAAEGAASKRDANDAAGPETVARGIDPVETAEGGACMQIGRVVVLPQYRGKRLGERVILEAEQWIRELGFDRVMVESRDVAVGFYEKLGYRVMDGKVIYCAPFQCIRMEKTLYRP